MIQPHLYAAFNEFQVDFESGLDDAGQLMRGGLLQYCLTFLPELIPHSLLRELSHFVTAARQDKKHDSFGWLALLHVNAGLFHYTGDDSWIDHALGNIAHENSGVRDRVAYALAMSASRMDAFDPRLIAGIETNFNTRHIGNGLQLALFIAARGEIPAKEAQLTEWRDRYPGVCGQREMTAWLGRGYIANPFAPWMQTFERYILMRFVTGLTTLPAQLVPLRSRHPVDVDRLLALNATLPGSELFSRLESHPLGGQYLELQRSSYHGDIFRRAKCGPARHHNFKPHRRNMDNPTIQRIFTALEFAAHEHRNQRRKGVSAFPYINHPVSVAAALVNIGKVDDLDIIEAALLHDTVEDCGVSAEEIEKRFGARVRGIVMELTDDKALEKEVRKQKQIDSAPHKSPPAKMLKLADKACNIRDIREDPPADWDAARKLAYFDWADKVVNGLRGVNESLERHFDREIAASREALKRITNGD